MIKTLRPYQEEAVTATLDYFKESKGNPLIVAPVAAGKSLLIAETAKRACTMHPNTRILVLAHVKELLQQNAAEMISQWPDANISFYCHGLGKKSDKGQIVFASIQSFSKMGLKTKSFDLIMVDECHLISPKSDTMYQKLFTDLAMANPHVKIIGYTGTPFRPDSGLLTDSDLFSDVAYEIEMQYLIDEGFLCPPITPNVNTKMDTTGVGTRGGDFIAGQLEKAVDKDEVTYACIDEMIEIGKDRKKWLIFTAGIEHAEHVTEALRSSGVSAAMVTGKTPKDERAAILSDYSNGLYQALVNVAVLTTGYNEPAIDLLAFMRPTRSPVLYVQCVGRGMRTHQDKEDVMILDFGGVVDELGPIDQVNVSKKAGDGTGEAPVKQCPKCYELLYAGVNECPKCGHMFESELNINERSAKDVAMLSSQIEPDVLDVIWMNTVKHEKKGKPPSLKVMYGTSSHIIKEWVCFEHQGFARDKAKKWHINRSGQPVPDTVDEALNIIYPTPTTITVRKNGAFDEIVSCDYKEKEEASLEEEIVW